MGAPRTAITRLDLSMTYAEFSLRANRMKFGWHKILPMLVVGNLSQTDIPRINLDSLLENTDRTDERAAWGSYERDHFNWDKDDYRLTEHGKEELVDDNLIEMFGDFIDAEMIARNKAINYILTRLETLVANMFFNTGVGGVIPIGQRTAAAAAWERGGGATPYTDIITAMEAVEDRTGCTPNKLVISNKRWRRFVDCEEWEDKLDMGTNSSPSQINQQGIMSLFPDLDEIVIVGGFKNTADKGAAAALGRVWADNLAMVACVSDADLTENDLTDTKPHLGRTLFHNDGGGAPSGADDENALILEEYREEQRRGGVIRARHYRQLKTWHIECAELLTGVG